MNVLVVVAGEPSGDGVCVVAIGEDIELSVPVAVDGGRKTPSVWARPWGRSNFDAGCGIPLGHRAATVRRPVINVLSKHPLMSDACDATRCIRLSAAAVFIT